MKFRTLNKLSRFFRLPILLLALSLVLIEARSDIGNIETLKKLFSRGYDFSQDYFTIQYKAFEKVTASYKGKPNISYLEIGTFEGASLIWMLENILTDPSAKATCIDPFLYPKNLYERFTKNLRLSGFSGKVTILQGLSQVKLRKLPLYSFDIIYIDGSHVPKDVLTDAVLSWGLLKEGGIMLLDDYGRLPVGGIPLPKAAIDSFLTYFRDELEIIYNGFTIVARKK